MAQKTATLIPTSGRYCLYCQGVDIFVKLLLLVTLLKV